MRATGIVRKVDDLGRIVLPIDVRRERGIEPKAELEIYVDSGDIILQKFRAPCVFCGGHEGLSGFRGRLVCQECRTHIATQFGSAAD